VLQPCDRLIYEGVPIRGLVVFSSWITLLDVVIKPWPLNHCSQSTWVSYLWLLSFHRFPSRAFLVPSNVKITHVWFLQYFSPSLLLPRWHHIATLHFTFQTIFIDNRSWSKNISSFTATDLEKWSISTLCFPCLCCTCPLLFIICRSFSVPWLFWAIRSLSAIIFWSIDGPRIFVCHNNQGHCVLCLSCISNPTPEEWLAGWDVSQRQDHSSSSDYGNKENLTTWRYIYTEGRQRFQRVGKDATWKHRPWGDGLYLMDFLYHNWYSIMQIHVSECVLYVPCFPSENDTRQTTRKFLIDRDTHRDLASTGYWNFTEESRLSCMLTISLDHTDVTILTAKD